MTTYAEAVVAVLREHFPDTTDTVTGEIIAKAVARQAADPQPSFECIVDDPGSARWRLKARSRDRRVRLAYYPVIPPGSVAGNALEQIVNAELDALDGPDDRDHAKANHHHRGRGAS